MRYKAYFSYYLNTGNDKNDIENFDLTIDSFEVDGGINQFIVVNDVDTESSVELELEQARTHSNIVLYLASDNRPKIMNASLDLGSLAADGLMFSTLVVVERYSGKKKVSGFGLVDLTAIIENSPQVVGDGLLKIKIKLSDPKILYGETGKHYMVGSYEVI